MSGKLCFPWMVAGKTKSPHGDAKRSFAEMRSQAELGNEDSRKAALSNYCREEKSPRAWRTRGIPGILRVVDGSLAPRAWFYGGRVSWPVEKAGFSKPGYCWPSKLCCAQKRL